MTHAVRPSVRVREVVHSLSVVHDRSQREALCRAMASGASARGGAGTVVSFLNAHALTLAWKNADFARHLAEADYLFRDGIGIAIMLRLIGVKAGINMNGSDLTPEIIRSFTGKKIALCGTQEPWLSQAAEAVEKMGAHVVSTMDGFQSEEVCVARLKSSGADLVILAMGMPKQESVAIRLAAEAERPMVIVNGGAIVDFLAGRFPCAPLIWRKMHMEWLFRLLNEPRRLTKRYVFGGCAFGYYVLRIVLQRHLFLKQS